MGDTGEVSTRLHISRVRGLASVFLKQVGSTSLVEITLPSEVRRCKLGETFCKVSEAGGCSARGICNPSVRLPPLRLRLHSRYGRQYALGSLGEC